MNRKKGFSQHKTTKRNIARWLGSRHMTAAQKESCGKREEEGSYVDLARRHPNTGRPSTGD